VEEVSCFPHGNGMHSPKEARVVKRGQPIRERMKPKATWADEETYYDLGPYDFSAW